MSRNQLLEDGSLGFLSRVKKSSPDNDPLRNKAEIQAAKGRLDGLHPFKCEGKFFLNDEGVQVSPAFRLGA